MAGRDNSMAATNDEDLPSREVNASLYFSRQRAPRTRQLDCELDIGSSNAGPFPKISFPKLHPESSIIRRFGVLHVRSLLYKQDKLRDLERGLPELDDLDKEPQFQRPDQAQTAEDSARRLLEVIDSKLSTYNSIVLSMPSLKRVPKHSIRSGQSVGEWIYNGPQIHLDRSDRILYKWKNYTHAVTKLLDDSTHSEWLNDPIDQYWTRDTKQSLKNLERDEGYVRKWIETVKRVQDKTVLIGGPVFWIFHITAALAYWIITSPPGFNEKSSVSSVTLGNLLLGYWYVSVVIIVVNEFLRQGYIYMRKIILGGVAACATSFYVGNILLQIPAISVIDAFPAVFTVVLVFIKIM